MLEQRRHATALLLNQHMRETSSEARLVVTNLPLIADMEPFAVLAHVETICEVCRHHRRNAYPSNLLQYRNCQIAFRTAATEHHLLVYAL